LRYENQTNINSKFNFAPRLGFAWSPGAANSTKPPKTVIRGGGGIFYNRFGEGQTLTANRFNGSNQIQYQLTEPFLTTSAPSQADLDLPLARPVYNLLNIFPNVPTQAQLTGIPTTQQTIYHVASNLQTPVVYLGGIQVERQLPRNITAYAALYTLRIQHVIRTRNVNAPLPGTITALTPNGIRPNPPELCTLFFTGTGPCALGDIFQYESSGKYHQSNFSLGFNSRLNPRISLSGNYTLSKTQNDTDGQGSGGFPVNSYDLTGEWGRASFDVRHRFSLFGTISSPWWKLVFSPFVTANTGPPFNIITGRDTNLDRIANERPTFAVLSAFCVVNPARCNRIDLNGNTSSDIIPRNFGNSPGQVSVTLRISRTFGFGGEANRRASSGQPGGGQTSAQGNGQKAGDGKPGETTAKASDTGRGGQGRGGPTIGGGPQKGPGGPGGGPGGGGPGMVMMGMGGGGQGGPSKYSLTASVSFQNLFNRVNLGRPEGNLLSPNFGQSLGLAGSFGGFGGGGGGSAGAGNRRISLNLRFTF